MPPYVVPIVAGLVVAVKPSSLASGRFREPDEPQGADHG